MRCLPKYVPNCTTRSHDPKSHHVGLLEDLLTERLALIWLDFERSPMVSIMCKQSVRAYQNGRGLPLHLRLE